MNITKKGFLDTKAITTKNELDLPVGVTSFATATIVRKGKEYNSFII